MRTRILGIGGDILLHGVFELLHIGEAILVRIGIGMQGQIHAVAGGPFAHLAHPFFLLGDTSILHDRTVGASLRLHRDGAPAALDRFAVLADGILLRLADDTRLAGEETPLFGVELHHGGRRLRCPEYGLEECHIRGRHTFMGWLGSLEPHLAPQRTILGGKANATNKHRG